MRGFYIEPPHKKRHLTRAEELGYAAVAMREAGYPESSIARHVEVLGADPCQGCRCTLDGKLVCPCHSELDGKEIP